MLAPANTTTKLLSAIETPLNHNIQLVFFDIDGTLLAKDGTYSETLKQHINRLHENGIKTAIASGRPSYAAQFLFDELGINDLGVFCTGAEVYHPAKAQHMHYHALEPQRVQVLYQRVRELGIYCEFYTPQYHTIEASSDISHIHGQHLRVEPRIMSGEAVFEQSLPLIKLLLGRHQQAPSQNLQTLAQEFPEFEFAFAHFLARPEWEFASVISPQANKQQAFSAVIEHYGIAAENVMSIGDSHSDMVFIQQAGVGVAMGNASDAVKAVANYITVDADDDGVAYALEKLVSNR